MSILNAQQKVQVLLIALEEIKDGPLANEEIHIRARDAIAMFHETGNPNYYSPWAKKLIIEVIKRDFFHLNKWLGEVKP